MAAAVGRRRLVLAVVGTSVLVGFGKHASPPVKATSTRYGPDACQTTFSRA